MNGFTKIALCTVLLPASLVLTPSCKKRVDKVKADLGEAGYKLTPEDWFRASGQNDVAAMKKFLAGGFSTDTRDR